MTRVALITGASSGIGEACARAFSKAGWTCVLAARRLDRVEALAQDLPTESVAVRLDVTDRESVLALPAALAGRLPGIDTLVNNAGLGLGEQRADLADPADWVRMIETNVTGLALLTHAVLPVMVQSGGGHVINIGSISATWPYPTSNVYGATKAFVHQFTLNLRADMFRHNIRATVVEPGMTRTEFPTVRNHGDSMAAGRTYAGAAPLDPEDVAAAVLWAAQQPARVNVNSIELMPSCQSFAGLAVDRR
jgi:3-hydroxy acid dehydrogenase / malonic semialdehyde reductase